MTIFVARPLGATLYGKVQYYVGIINILSMIICFGFPSYLIKSSQFESNHKAFFSKTMFAVDFLSIVIFPCFFLVSYFALSKLGKDPILITALFIASLVQSLGSILASFLLGVKKPSQSIFIDNILPKGLLLIASMIFIFFGATEDFPTYYIYLYLGIHLACILPFIIKFLSKTKVFFTKKEIISIATFFLISVTYSLNDSIAKVIQGEYSTTFDSVGIFALSTQIISFSTIFSNAITSISRPAFSQLAQAGDDEKLIAFYKKILRVNSYIAIPFIVALCVQSLNVLGLFGPSYQAYPFILIIVGIASLFSTITGPSGTMLAMAGHERFELVNGLISLGLFLGFSFWLVNLTIYGLPLAILISTIVVNIIKLIEVNVIYKKIPMDMKTIIHLLVLIVLSLGVFYVLSFISNKLFWIASNLLSGIAIIILFFIVNPNPEDKHFLITVNGKTKKVAE